MIHRQCVNDSVSLTQLSIDACTSVLPKSNAFVNMERTCVQEKAQQKFAVSMGISAHEVTLEQLADEIAQVYERCGFDRDATVSTLQMLTNIEVSIQHAI